MDESAVPFVDGLPRNPPPSASSFTPNLPHGTFADSRPVIRSRTPQRPLRHFSLAHDRPRALAPALVILLTVALAPTFSTLPSAVAADPVSSKVVWFPEDNRSTPGRLEQRRLEQVQAAAAMTAFHAFRFSHRTPDSGITFEERRVDDALRDFLPAHYDHGEGLAAADVDGDGHLDLYFVTHLGSNALYRGLGNGRFEDFTREAGLALPDHLSVAPSFADLDNDGDPDLLVTSTRLGNRFFENTGHGRFQDRTEASGLGYVGHSSSAVFLDFDQDGRLDIFLCNVGRFTTDERGRGGYFRSVTNAFDGHLFPERTEFSLLYRNLGGLRFAEVSQDLGLRDGGWTGDAAVVDFNGDRFPDLYVLNMQGDNRYYENQGGQRFIERTPALFPRTPWGAMGVKSFDFNLDGHLDLLVTDMHSDMTTLQIVAGRRNLRTAFEKTKSEAWCTTEWTDALLQGASNNLFGNAFFVNQGDGRFLEQSDALGLETFWPWGVSVADLNADGFEDVFVTAGMGYPFRYGINSLLLNEQGRRFFDAEFLVGIEPRAGGIAKNLFELDCDGPDRDHPRCAGESGRLLVRGPFSSRSSVILDLDNDGDLDLVTSENSALPQVLVSDLSDRVPLHYLKVRLVGTRSNRDALGAVVRLHAGGKTQTRYHEGKSGYLSMSSMPLYFGLGDATRVDRLEVLWPSGERTDLTDPGPINRLITLVEPASTP